MKKLRRIRSVANSLSVIVALFVWAESLSLSASAQAANAKACKQFSKRYRDLFKKANIEQGRIVLMQRKVEFYAQQAQKQEYSYQRQVDSEFADLNKVGEKFADSLGKEWLFKLDGTGNDFTMTTIGLSGPPIPAFPDAVLKPHDDLTASFLESLAFKFDISSDSNIYSGYLEDWYELKNGKKPADDDRAKLYELKKSQSIQRVRESIIKLRKSLIHILELRVKSSICGPLINDAAGVNFYCTAALQKKILKAHKTQCRYFYRSNYYRSLIENTKVNAFAASCTNDIFGNRDVLLAKRKELEDKVLRVYAQSLEVPKGAKCS